MELPESMKNMFNDRGRCCCSGLLATFFFLLQLLAGGAEVEMRNVGAYAIDDVVLKNRFLTVVVRPHQGARIISLMYRPSGREQAKWFTSGRTEDGGLLRDLAPSTPHPGEFAEAQFDYQIIENGPGVAAVRFECAGSSVHTRGLLFSKTMRLCENSPDLVVELKIENREHGIQTVDWRVHNWVTPAGSWDFGRDHCLLTTPDGVVEMSSEINEQLPRLGNRYISDFFAGWMAIVDREEQEGLAFIANYHQLDRQLFWIDRENVTLELFYTPVTLNPGDTWSSTLRLAVFSGFERIDHAGVTGVYRYDGKTGKLKVFPFADGELSVTAWSATTSEAHEQMLSHSLVKVTPGTVFSLTAPAPDRHGGGFRFVAELKGRKEEFIIPVAEKFTMTPPRKRPPPLSSKKVEELQIVQNDSAASKPTTIKVLQLSTFQYEPSQDGNRSRLASYRIPFRARNLFGYYLRDQADIIVDNATESTLAEYLPHLYDYDLLILNDFRAELISSYIEPIKEYVRRGHGLLVLGGVAAFGGRGQWGNYHELASLLPVEVSQSPDWVDQTPYPPGRSGAHPENGAFVEYPCSECSETIRYYRGFFPIQESWQWLKAGTCIRALMPKHPAIAGIPLDSLSPSYHQVEAKAGTQTLASVDQNPVIVVQDLGQGRVAAVTLSDYRRFYFWPYTSALCERLVRWCAATTKQPALTVAMENSKEVVVELHNVDRVGANPVLKAWVAAPDNQIHWLTQGEALEETLSEVVQRRFDWPKIESPLPGDYRIVAEVGGHHAESLHSLAPRSDIELVIHLRHKHNYARGEMLHPTVILNPHPAGVATVRLYLVDEAGHRIVHRELVPQDGRGTLEIPTKNLAYGNYRFWAEAVDRNGTVVASKMTSIRVCPKRALEFPIFYYGMLGGGAGSYSQLASVDYLMEDTSLIITPKVGPKQPHQYSIIDRGFGKGGQFLLDCNRATYYGPPGWRRDLDSQRSPSKLNWMREFLKEQLDGYENLSGIYGAYIDDEGNTCSISEYDRNEFKREYGFDLPENPQTLEEKMALGRYYLESTDLLYGLNAEVAREMNPDWKTFFIKCPSGNRGHRLGIDIEENFKSAAAIMPDIYPKSVFDIGQDFMFMNLARCAGKRLEKPVYFVMQCVYGTVKEARMQYWLLLGSGLEGYGWYSIAAGYSEMYDKLKPLNQFAREFSPLFARWEKPASELAVLYSDAMLSQENVAPYHNRLIGMSDKLYGIDLYPDFVRESQILDGSANQYQVLILSGIEELVPAVTDKITKMSKTKMVLLDGGNLSVEGVTPFDLGVLRKRVIPQIQTPDPLVFAEPLFAEGMKYAVVYNHRGEEIATEIKVRESAEIASIYELGEGRKVPFVRKDGVIIVREDFEPFSGRVYALFEREPEQLRLLISDTIIKRGQTATLEVNLEPAPNGIVPVKITVYDPTGKKSDYSDRLAASNGLATLKIPFAGNDILGEWTVKVQNMITRHLAEAKIELLDSL